MGRLKACLISRSYLPVLLVLIVASSSVAVYFLYPFQTVAVPRVGGGAAIVDTLSERHPAQISKKKSEECSEWQECLFACTTRLQYRWTS